MLSPHLHEIVVIGVPKNRGPKNDKIDAFGLAEKLRIGAVETRVYKKRGAFAALGERCRAYNFLVADSVRVQNRIKSLFRSRGIPSSGRQVYAAGRRKQWIEKLPATSQPLAETLYLEYDALEELRERAEKAMLEEARKHAIYRLLTTVPGPGKIRAAQLLPIVVTPYRFASKRSFWAYCGLAIVMRSSADWVRTRDGRRIKTKIQQTRGLNKNYNHILKQIFKGAATTVIGRANDEPLHNHYQQLLDGGTKPNLARLTIARQIASIVLSIWRSQEVYDPKKVSQAT